MLKTSAFLDLVPFANNHLPEGVSETTAIVFNWPNYSKGNPYQYLLYRQNALGLRSYFGNIDRAIDLLENNLSPVPVVFHLHWLNWLFTPAKTPAQAHQRALHFLAKLARFKDLGGVLIWTVHNEISHEANHNAAETLLSERLCQLADRIHLHERQSLDEVGAFDIPRHKAVVFPHGHYIDEYPDDVTRDEARGVLNIAPDDDLCVFVGQVRKYKGVDTLIEAFRRVRQTRPKLKLAIAGSFQYDPFENLERPLSAEEDAAILRHSYFLDDARLQFYFRAADFSVLPYTKILTSGSVLLSLSFDTPVIASDNAMIREVLSDAALGTLIDTPPSPHQLAKAMQTMLARKDAGSLRLGDKTRRAFAAEHAWRDFTREVIEPLLVTARPADDLRSRLKGKPLAPSIAVEEYAALLSSDGFDPKAFADRHPSLCATARDPGAGFLEAARLSIARPQDGTSATVQSDQLEAFCRTLRPAWRADCREVRLSLLCTGQNVSPVLATRILTQALMAEPNLAIDVIVPKGSGIGAALADGVQEALSTGRLTLHRIGDPDRPVSAALKAACEQPSAGPVVIVDAARAPLDLAPLITRAQGLHTAGVFVDLPGPDAPEGHLLSISGPLLATLTPYAPLSDAILPGLLAAKARQACAAVAIHGAQGQKPGFGLPAPCPAILAQSGLASLPPSIGVPRPTAVPAEATQAMFDLTDALIDGTKDPSVKTALKKENTRARAAYVAAHRTRSNLNAHFKHMSGPTRGIAEGGALLVTCVRNDHAFLPAFFEHYRSLGIQHFVVVDDQSRPGVHRHHSSPDITVLQPKSGRFFTSKTLWLELVISHFAAPGTWITTVDADEFLDLPPHVSGLNDLTRQLTASGQVCLPCLLVDMLPGDKVQPGTPQDFLSSFTRSSWTKTAPPETYRTQNTVKWGFGPFAALSWAIDARHHIFGMHECLRKFSLFQYRPGFHLNQGFHTLIDRTGHNLVQADAWARGPIGYLRHYKFLKFLSSEAGLRPEALHGVYFEETARNLERAYGCTPAEVLRKIQACDTAEYTPAALTKLITQVRNDVSQP